MKYRLGISTLLIAGLALFGTGCAAGGGGGGVGGSNITAEQLASSSFNNAYEVLARNSNVEFRGGEMYLRGRGQTTIGESAPALLVLGGSRLSSGAGGVLQGVNLNQIERIRILRPADATQEFGVQGGAGAVVVELQRE